MLRLFFIYLYVVKAKNNHIILLLVIGLIIFFVIKNGNHYVNSNLSENQSLSTKTIPKQAYKIYNYIILYGKAPDNYIGGREFKNIEKRLPLRNKKKEKIKYREWDIWPKKYGKNRGPERLVTSDDGRAWYSPNHYKSFMELKPRESKK